jgi:sec-independent protein translocase protein TatA
VKIVIAGMEWILLLIIVAALLFGAKKIPEFAQNLGRAKAEFQRGQMMVEREIREERLKDDAKQRTLLAEKKQDNVTKAAKALGIDTEGKTKQELKKEIDSKMNE